MAPKLVHTIGHSYICAAAKQEIGYHEVDGPTGVGPPELVSFALATTHKFWFTMYHNVTKFSFIKFIHRLLISSIKHGSWELWHKILLIPKNYRVNSCDICNVSFKHDRRHWLHVIQLFMVQCKHWIQFLFYQTRRSQRIHIVQIERHHKIWTIRYSPYRRCTRSNTDLLFIRQEIVTKKLAKSKNLVLNISKILTANDAMTSWDPSNP